MSQMKFEINRWRDYYDRSYKMLHDLNSGGETTDKEVQCVLKCVSIYLDATGMKRKHPLIAEQRKL